MKRFWKDVAVEAEDGGWTIRLDGRPVKTPARAALIVPTRVLADAIAYEWSSVDGEIDPRKMPLTGLANAAIDRVAPAKEEFAASLACYAEADLACYRSDGPKELVDRQEAGWNELLAWARRRYDVDFATTTGVTHVTQPAATVERLTHAVSSLDPFRLAGFSPLVTIGGSLVGALAVIEKALPADTVWNALSLDDQWQLERWGSDAEAEAALENRKRDFLAAANFLDVLDG